MSKTWKDNFQTAIQQDKSAIFEKWSKKFPESYETIFKDLIAGIHAKVEDQYWQCPNPEGVTSISNGSYQGNTLFIAKSNSSDQFFVTTFGFGSCSGCDCLQGIHSASRWNDPDEPYTVPQEDLESAWGILEAMLNSMQMIE